MLFENFKNRNLTIYEIAEKFFFKNPKFSSFENSSKILNPSSNSFHPKFLIFVIIARITFQSLAIAPRCA